MRLGISEIKVGILLEVGGMVYERRNTLCWYNGRKDRLYKISLLCILCRVDLSVMHVLYACDPDIW